MATEAQLRAKRKYEANNYDVIRARLPKGSVDKIKSLGYSINGFVVQAVLEKLAEMEK